MGSRIIEVIFSFILRFDPAIVIVLLSPYLMLSQSLFSALHEFAFSFLYIVLFLNTLSYFFFFKDLFCCIKK